MNISIIKKKRLINSYNTSDEKMTRFKRTKKYSFISVQIQLEEGWILCGRVKIRKPPKNCPRRWIFYLKQIFKKIVHPAKKVNIWKKKEMAKERDSQGARIKGNFPSSQRRSASAPWEERRLSLSCSRGHARRGHAVSLPNMAGRGILSTSRARTTLAGAGRERTRFVPLRRNAETRGGRHGWDELRDERKRPNHGEKGRETAAKVER